MCYNAEMICSNCKQTVTLKDENGNPVYYKEDWSDPKNRVVEFVYCGAECATQHHNKDYV